jgi:hypothetical protein
MSKDNLIVPIFEIFFFEDKKEGDDATKTWRKPEESEA